MTTEPKPTLDVTYRRADGEPIDDFAWVTDIEYLDEQEDPILVVEERWTRVNVRTYWHTPGIGTQWCRYVTNDDDDECEDDADEWVTVNNGPPIPMCAAHAALTKEVL